MKQWKNGAYNVAFSMGDETKLIFERAEKKK